MFIIPDVYDLNEMKNISQIEIKCFQKIYKFWAENENILIINKLKNKLELFFEEIERKYSGFSQEQKLLALLFLILNNNNSEENLKQKEQTKIIISSILDKILQEVQ